MGLPPEVHPGALPETDSTMGTKGLLKAEAMEALLYGCMTWAPRRKHYDIVKTTHHRLLLRAIGYGRTRGQYRQLSYAPAPQKVDAKA